MLGDQGACVCASYGLGAGRPLMPLNERGKDDLVGRQGQHIKHSSAVSEGDRSRLYMYKSAWVLLEPWLDPVAMVRRRSQWRSPKSPLIGGPRTIKAPKEPKKEKEKERGPRVGYSNGQSELSRDNRRPRSGRHVVRKPVWFEALFKNK